MRTFIFIFLFLLPSLLKGQISTQPTVVTETGKVEIIFNAALGNQGLKGYTGTVYAHTGVITNKSNNGNDWKYAPVWGVNDDKYKMSSLGNNLWKLTIAPGVRSWYGVASTEKIRKLAFVFRSSDSKKEGKGEGDADLFVPLNENEFIPSTPQSKPRPTRPSHSHFLLPERNMFIYWAISITGKKTTTGNCTKMATIGGIP